MTNLPKATFVVASALAATLFGLAACNKAPNRSEAASGVGANVGPSVKGAVTAELKEPPVPDRERTDPEADAMRDAYVKWVVEKAYPSGLRRPDFPDPRRIDRAAQIQGVKYSLWRVAETQIAGQKALKAQGEQLGVDKPAPKSTYGSMAEGLPHLSSGQK